MAEGQEKYSFEEFRLMYESTEKVTDRRLQTNRWNYTICIAVLVAIAGILKYSVNNPPFFYLGLAAVIVLSGMAILFCSLWIGQIRDFKSLNNAKFDIINSMAPHVEFDPDHPGTITSFCSFEKEWKRLEEMKALQDAGKTNFIALKSTNIEYFIPKAFIALFVAIVLVAFIFILPNRTEYLKETNQTNQKTAVHIKNPKP
jgi:membrane protein YdbS with pleckstrin-like domain